MNKLIQKALHIMECDFKADSGVFNKSEMVKDYCRLQLGNEPEEVFGVIYLNNHLGLLGFEKLMRGSVNQATVHPRVIARRMFELNAAKMILVHNHPSGSVKPSAADVDITKTLIALFKQLDCQIVDHVIVSAIDTFSMAEEMHTIF